MPPEDAVREFQKIWLQEYGVQITYEEAEIEAKRMLKLFKLAVDTNYFHSL